MIVNRGNLRTLFIGHSTAFRGALDTTPPMWPRVAMRVPSTTRANEYSWLGMLPRIREWIGERVIQNLTSYDYTIKNKSWELTIGVQRDDIEDDNIGIYAPLFSEMGRSTAAFPDELLWPLLINGFVLKCYDGQPFFDTDHPVLDASGVTVSVSNNQGGAGTPWFLLDTTRALKPLIFQERRVFDFVAMDDPTDEVAFSRKEFRYGVDGRCNAGYGLWQTAYGSKQALTAANYAAARTAMTGMKGDYARPLALRPGLLVVPPGLEAEGKAIIEAERNAAGATNVWRNTAELLVVPWLAT